MYAPAVVFHNAVHHRVAAVAHLAVAAHDEAAHLAVAAQGEAAHLAVVAQGVTVLVERVTVPAEGVTALAEGVTAHLVAAAQAVDRPAVVKVNVVGPQP